MALNEHAKQLVAALRSGDYLQGRGSLRNVAYDGEPLHCCLGVASDLLVQEGNSEWQGVGDDLDVLFVYRDYDGVSYGESETELVEDVMNYYGFATPEGGFMCGFVYETLTGITGRSLMDLNDSGATFEEIADCIESEPPGLFGKLRF